MKNIVVEVPRTGASVELVLRAGASSGQVVIVASDDVEVRVAEPARAVVTRPKSPTETKRAPASKAPAYDLDLILKRLRKLKTTKGAAAANSIKAMFQFDGAISDETANKILEDLRKRGSLSIDANDKLQFRNS